MKINLTNKTAYRDDDLRTIVKEACKQAGVSPDAKRLRLVISPGKLHIRGRATVPPSRRQLLAGYMLLKIPPFKFWGPGRHGERARTEREWITEICRVALHEAMHLAGVRHRDMTEEQYHCRMPVPWADAIQLRAKEEPDVVPREERLASARADRLEHAQAMFAKAGTRRKRAITIEKKWKRRVALLSR